MERQPSLGTVAAGRFDRLASSHCNHKETPAAILPLPGSRPVRHTSLTAEIRRRGVEAHDDKITSWAPRAHAGRARGPRRRSAWRQHGRAGRLRYGPGGDPEPDAGAHPVQWRRGRAGRILRPAADAQALPKGFTEFHVPCWRRLAAALRQRQPRQAVADRPRDGQGGAVLGRCQRARRCVLRHRLQTDRVAQLRFPSESEAARDSPGTAGSTPSTRRPRPVVRKASGYLASPTRRLATMSSPSGSWMPRPCRRWISRHGARSCGSHSPASTTAPTS